MAVGLNVTTVTGRLIFDLVRGAEETTRVIDIPYAKTDTTSETLQSAINDINATFTTSENNNNILIQPANWRDDNVIEKQWTTTKVSYEVVVTTRTPIEPDED